MMGKPDLIYCERCGEKLKSAVWLELSSSDGMYYNTIPEGHESQGSFSFGSSCAKIQLIETRNALIKTNLITK